MLVSHIIPCLDGIGMTMQCLERLDRYDKSDKEVILIDDGSVEKYSSYFYEMSYVVDIVLEHESNMGFPKSVNDGILNANGDLIAIWNNDLMVSSNWLEPIIQHLENDKECVYGMLSPIIYNRWVGDYVEFEEFQQLFPDGWNNGKSHAIIDFLKGMPWVFRREVFDKVGLFDERFVKTYYEDDDFLLRMAINGYKHGSVENTAVFHYNQYTTRNVLEPKIGQGFIQENKQRFIDKWGKTPPAINIEEVYRTGTL